jgi:hypothetical protein
MPKLKILLARARVRFAMIPDPRPAISSSIEITCFRLISIAFQFFHRGQQLPVNRPLVFAPAPLQYLGVLLEVKLGQLAERLRSSLSLLLSGGIRAVSGVTQGSSSEPASIGKAEGRVGAEGHPSEPAVMPIDCDPGPLSCRGDAKAEARSVGIPVVDLPLVGRLDGVDKQLGKGDAHMISELFT